MLYSPLIDQLIEAFRCLPGVGPKSAQRMAFYLLERNKTGAKKLADTLLAALAKVDRCGRCRNLCETPICNLCVDPKRDASILCIVETPADVVAIEQTSSFRGLYFVLGGHLSPIDGIGPEEIGMEKLRERFAEKQINEVILATNPTVEGEATAHYVAELAKHHGVSASRIAYGVPLGGELEYIDANTLARALARREVY